MPRPEPDIDRDGRWYIHVGKLGPTPETYSKTGETQAPSKGKLPKDLGYPRNLGGGGMCAEACGRPRES